MLRNNLYYLSVIFILYCREQNVANAPSQFFERCGGAMHFKIKTVVGIPIPSPSFGRIVVCLYSTHDRSKDQEMVAKFYEEFSKVRIPYGFMIDPIGSFSVTHLHRYIS